MSTPDYNFWDQFSEYPLNVAAFLCHDIEPPENAESWVSMPPEVMKTRADLKAFGLATTNHKTTATTIEVNGEPRVFTHNHDVEFTIRRDKLRLWAEEMGFRKRIPFLFPEDRTAKVSPSTRTLYAIIRALALALVQAHPNLLSKNGKPFLGYSKGKYVGIVGYLVGGGYTDLKTTALQEHIKEALRRDTI